MRYKGPPRDGTVQHSPGTASFEQRGGRIPWSPGNLTVLPDLFFSPAPQNTRELSNGRLRRKPEPPARTAPQPPRFAPWLSHPLPQGLKNEKRQKAFILTVKIECVTLVTNQPA